ncbi:MAG: hypothetical protein R3F43_28685 [bacterium]
MAGCLPAEDPLDGGDARAAPMDGAMADATADAAVTRRGRPMAP